MKIRKITEDEVRSLWVQRLPDTPNRSGRFGAPGMTAAEVKAAYDALALRIVERYNELVDVILSGALSDLIPTGHEEDTLADLLRDVQSGALSEYLTLDGKRSLFALAAAFDTHTHKGAYAPLDDGRIPMEFLPTDFDGALGTLADEVRSGEAERAKAEKRREAVIKTLEETILALEQREQERDLRESERDLRESERDWRISACEKKASNSMLLSNEVRRATEALARQVTNLSVANEGVTYEFKEAPGSARCKVVPMNALPNAALRRLGGGARGANALQFEENSELLSATGAVYGRRLGEKIIQTLGTSGVDTYWSGTRLLLLPQMTYTLAFDVYIDPCVSGTATFVFGCYRPETGSYLYKKSFTVPERGKYTRVRIVFDAPPSAMSDGGYCDAGALMLAYTGKEPLTGNGIRMTAISLDEGVTDGSYRAPEGRKGVPVSALLVHGVNLLPFPYPHQNSENIKGDIEFTEMEDGSLLLNGTASRNVSYTLYGTEDGLQLPEGNVYIAPIKNSSIFLYLKIGASGDVWRTGAARLSKNDEYYGRYYVYIYIPKDTVLVNERIYPCICLGSEAREAVPYRKPIRYEIPAEIKSLPGYGYGDNYLDFEEGLFHAARNSDGVLMPTEKTYPFDDYFLPGGCLEVVPGGMIEFENPAGERIDSTLLYEVKKG